VVAATEKEEASVENLGTAILVILGVLLLWGLVKALVRTAVVALILVGLWLAADQAFPEEMAALREEIGGLSVPLLGEVLPGLLGAIRSEFSEGSSEADSEAELDSLTISADSVPG
jgi:hypothetical protein